MLVPAGGLVSTAADLVRFVRANLAPGETALVEALELAQEPRGRAARGLSVGLGWLIAHRPGTAVHWHNGGTWGFRSFAGFERERRRGVVVLAARARSVDRLALRLLKALPG